MLAGAVVQPIRMGYTSGVFRKTARWLQNGNQRKNMKLLRES
jgi:hypothetical protein